ncbi:hypothetical protein RSOLAG22IIIB_06639 [Rhizoctonia solani]|uniref:Uncharacterized protein n=1 Tax=Rhizoctonia solani TaxID=456999 RepID=A0A0K6GFD3_9AGAM|nr:hypothetical protein RSOLAG22IIIB_06639 [Rhizoctonia solani]
MSVSNSHDDDSEGSEDLGEHDNASIEDETFPGIHRAGGVLVHEVDGSVEPQIMGNFDRKMKEIQLSNLETQSLEKAWDFTITDYDPDNFDLQDELRQATGIGKRKGKGRARSPRQVQLSHEVNHFLGHAHSAYTSGDHETAIKLLRDVITIEHGVANAWGTLGFCCEDVSDNLRALELWIMAAHLESNSDQRSEIDVWDSCAALYSIK